MMMHVRLDYSNTANYIICIDPFDLRFYYIKIVHLELNYEILYPIFHPKDESVTKELDWEVELAVVIGKKGKYIKVSLLSLWSNLKFN